MSNGSPAFSGINSTANNQRPNNLFLEIHNRWGNLSGNQGLNESMNEDVGSTGSLLKKVEKQAEAIAVDVFDNYEVEQEQRCPDRFCKAMRQTVKEVSDRYEVALRSKVDTFTNRRDCDMFQNFVKVADELFEDGVINWGKVIFLYAFASRLTAYLKKKNPENKDKIGLYVGKYVGSKLGRWILDNGGWDGFADSFLRENAVKDKTWMGILLSKALGAKDPSANSMAN